jgi:type IV pilus assembly protein PilA
MERPRARGRRSGEAGFTLIELMVVVLIIAILIAIAIPTFLGARSRAQDRVAQSNLRNALTAEKTYYVDNQAYTADTSVLAGIEPPLTWTADAAVASTGRVYVATATSTGGVTDDTVILGAKSASGTCFYLRDQATKGTSTAPGLSYARDTACARPGFDHGHRVRLVGPDSRTSGGHSGPPIVGGSQLEAPDRPRGPRPAGCRRR